MALFHKIENYIRKLNFQPSIIGILVNPFYLIRLHLYKKIKYLSKHITGNLIDFGCGRKPYENLFNVDTYVGVDIEVSGHSHKLSKIDVYYDGKTIPFPDNTFESMICFEVLEHIFNPAEIVPELNRVLKPNGKILLSVPFCWNEHEIPFDYARYSSFGIKHLLEQHGFNVIEIHKTGNFNLVLFQLRILSIYEFLKPLGKLGYAITLFFSIPLTLLGILVGLFSSKNPSMYFNTIVLAEKK